MKKVNKFLSFTAFAILLNFLCVATIFAESVKINGGQDEIYTTGGSGSAVFDKATNTLTLNGYNNDSILFDGFDGKTINVVLKGKNTIKSTGGYVDGSLTAALGFDYETAEDEVVFNVTGTDGSSLDISDYFLGIFIPYGTLNIKNLTATIDQSKITIGESNAIFTLGDINVENSNIKFKGDNEIFPAVGIHSTAGDIKVKGTTLDLATYLYGIYTEGAITLEDVIYKSNGIEVNDFYSLGDMTFKNSNITSNNGLDLVGISEEGELKIIDSKLDVEKRMGGFISQKGTVTNSKLNFKNMSVPEETEGENIYSVEIVESIIFNVPDELTFTNCNINIENFETFSDSGSTIFDNCNINIENFGYFVYGPEATVKNSKINAKCEDAISFLFDTFEILNLENTIINTEGVAAGILNSNVVMINKSVFNFNNGLVFAGDVNDLTIKDSSVNANCILDTGVGTPYPAILAYSFVKVDNSDVTLKTEFPVALLVRKSDDVGDISDYLLIKNATIKESNILLGKTQGDLGIIDGVFYSLFTSAPETEYDFEHFEDLLEITANEVHIVAKNKVAFDANGGSGEMNNLFGAGKTSLPENGFTAPNGKRFKGWSLTKNGEIITELDINGNNTLYAIWEDIPKEKEVEEKEAKEEVIPDTIDKVVTYISLGLGSIAIILGAKKLYNKKNEA